jgi:NAD(P)-dependent dehydrogenase (short-subunit alcohol dehydrogenase family)
MNFQGQTVIITGASGNLGAAVARAFAAQGANLVLVDQSTDALRRSGFDDDTRAMLSVTDLLDQAQVDAMVKAAVAKFDGVHVLCNLAGGFRMGQAVHETSDKTWNFLFDINARTLLHAARAVVPQMLGQPTNANGSRGKIINVGAFGAQKGGASMGAYAASKASVMRLTESMAAELREQGINVNAVLPTIIDTPQNRIDMPDADPAKWVAPEALADVVLFLASDASRAVHGALLPVTGLS